jgi:hypothetical protein
MPVPAVFEAAFEYDGIRIRVDVMECLLSAGWRLCEVKSSSGLKDHYIDDIALQAYVLRGAGVALASIELLHVNTAYVRGADGIVWPEFFARLDVADGVAAALADLPGPLPAMRDCLKAGTLPEAEPGLQCGDPPTHATSGIVAQRISQRTGFLLAAPVGGPGRGRVKRVVGDEWCLPVHGDPC